MRAILVQRTGSTPATHETTMTIHRTILAAAFALGFTSAAHAGDLPPFAAESIDLGAVSGVAYYTVEHDGFRVVVVLAQGGTGTPVWFETLLAPGQSVVLSTPHNAGAAGKSIEISRRDDQVLVQDAAVATN
jgi:hypothetical protein